MNLLWAFEFTPAKDPVTGLPIDIDLNDMADVRVFSPQYKLIRADIVAVGCVDCTETLPV